MSVDLIIELEKLLSYYLTHRCREYDPRINQPEVFFPKRREHSRLVAFVMFLAAKRKDIGIKPEIALKAGFLHDIGYSPRLGYREYVNKEGQLVRDAHGYLGGQELEKLGMLEIAQAVYTHGSTLEEVEYSWSRELTEREKELFTPKPSTFPGNISLSELLTWADTHAAQDRLVTPEERMRNLKKRASRGILSSIKGKQIKACRPRIDPILPKVDKILNLDELAEKIIFLNQICAL